MDQISYLSAHVTPGKVVVTCNNMKMRLGAKSADAVAKRVVIVVLGGLADDISVRSKAQ